MQNTRYRKFVLFFTTFIIWSLMTALWGWVWYRFYADIILLPFYRRGNWMIIAVYGVLLYIITHFYGGYRVGSYRRGDVIFSSILSMAVTNGITYLQTSLVGRQFMDGRPILWMTIVDFVLLWVWATLACKLYIRLNPPRQLLVVYGGSSMTQSLILKMAQRDDKYLIREAVNIDEGHLRVMERINQFQAVLICDVKSTHRNRILKYCYSKNIRVYMTPKISDILIRGAGGVHLFDTPLLLSRNEGLSVDQRFFKRLLDIVLSVAALAVLWPFLLLTAIAIKLGDGGPVLFKQDRLTLNAKVFSLYKFRSMVVDAEKNTGARLASQNDDRITPVGRFIRKVRLDELPQLINILKGEMSIVGPRPERPEIAEQYRQTMEEFDFRLKVKAGLTGYAQVLGKYNTTPYDKLKLDLMYITGYSFLLDIKLILQTIKILFMRDSTEGIGEGQTTAKLE